MEAGGNLPGLSTGQTDCDDEDEREESERDHDGILENLSCMRAHLDCAEPLPAPLYEENKRSGYPVMKGLVVS